ncbi:MAG: hypothetical protein V1787_00680 [Candidatus Micrarchaeota archaeon]
MELKPFRLEFNPGWDRHFRKFDRAVQERILAKLEQMKQPLPARGMHASRYKIEEAGGYRIAYIQDDEKREKRIHFVGDHKQYEEWYSSK